MVNKTGAPSHVISAPADNPSPAASQHDATDAALYREMRSALAEYESLVAAPAWDGSTSASLVHRQQHQQEVNGSTIPATKTRLPPRHKAFYHALRSVLAQPSFQAATLQPTVVDISTEAPEQSTVVLV
eukprot:gene9409-9573_t